MNEQRRQQKLDFMIQVGYIVTIALIVYVAFKYGLSLLLPFLLGYAVALLIKPAVDLLKKELKFPRSLATLLMMILCYGIVGLLVVLLSVKLVGVVKDFFVRIPEFYSSYIAPAITSLFDGLERLVQYVDPNDAFDLGAVASEVTSALGSLFSSASAGILNFAASTAASLPNFLLRILFTVMSTFYFTMDYDLINRFLLAQMSKRTQDIMRDAKRNLGKTLGGYLRSYGLIMLVTFVELWIGLSIIGIKDALFISMIIAMFDILPVVGCGTVLVPWMIERFAQGFISQALGLSILWVIISIVRNIIEPRIVGNRVGLHPLLTIMGMFVGAYLFGGIGIFLVPISLALLLNMHRSGVIQLYKEKAKPGKGN